MKLLIVADNENNNLWGNWDERWSKTLSEISLVLSAGDLAPAYLEFIAGKLSVPVLYVRGNHDSYYEVMPPKGCMDIDGKVVDIFGLKIAGLGGSMRYREGCDMYTEKEQIIRTRALAEKIQNDPHGSHHIKKTGVDNKKLDIFLTHSPCRGYGDLDDLPHTGFECFNSFLEQFKPQFHFYGHVHMEYGIDKRARLHSSGTTTINCCGMCIIETDK